MHKFCVSTSNTVPGHCKTSN